MLAPRSGLTALPKGFSGAAGETPGVVVSEVLPDGAAGLAARRDCLPDLLARAGALGLDLPTQPRWTEGGGLQAIWIGPERWLILGPLDVPQQLAAHFGGAASVTDQSDARVILSIGGPRARDALAKGVGIDLHPVVFRSGDAAVTLAARIPVILWHTGGTPCYRLAVARSYAGSLAEWLAGAAAEYGLLVA
jgi:sarcosine oxidase subunit gamma